MENYNDIRHGRHCVFLLHVHLVFITKYRRKAFTKEVIDFMKPIFVKICKDFESELIEFDGESDHVHLLINYPPKVSISKLVNSLKGVSSRKVRQQKFKSVDSKLWGDSLWSPSYFAGSCGGASLDVVKKYIEQQETPKKFAYITDLKDGVFRKRLIKINYLIKMLLFILLLLIIY